ncbi:MAG TPA: Fic family protein [Solirubrobacteraceae bacterium]|jgi:Fic family protein|nr:Fic family protein [Solirubrobacteraceae bacterium]
MRSFVDIDATFADQPRELGAVLARIDTGRGRERLFEDQMPELLVRLSEHARIASITASNAIEGVVVGSERAERIAAGSDRYRNRNEREFAGYRDAIDALMRMREYEPLSVPLVLHLHRLLFAHTDGRGGHLKSDQNLIVSYESGRREVIFTPPAPEETEFLLSELLARYNALKLDGRTHPLVLIGALVLDLLAIHPVADGNGRLARLITTHELLSQSYGVARYVSLEERIYEAKNAYYASLYESQREWHETRQNIWPWVTYLARVLADAYDDFERRVAGSAQIGGSKQGRVRDYILSQAPPEFRRRDIERAFPGVSAATIRLVLNELRDRDLIRSHGAGPGARWQRL